MTNDALLGWEPRSRDEHKEVAIELYRQCEVWSKRCCYEICWHMRGDLMVQETKILRESAAEIKWSHHYLFLLWPQTLVDRL